MKKLFTMKIDSQTLDEWKAKADEAGISVAELIRRSVAGQKIERANPQHFPPPPKVDPELLRQVAAIGNNINQIARRCNSGGIFDVLAVLLEIEKRLQELVEKVESAHKVS